VGAGTGVAIRGNSIFSNGGLGIKLGGGLGPNINDAGDGDTGPNQFQNYPVITNAVVSPGDAVVTGTLNSAASANFRIDFFASTACEPFNGGHGEGQSFLGATTVATDAGGNAGFGPLLFPAPAGQPFITATATDAFGNTSEFSVCVAATTFAPLPTVSIASMSALEGDSGNTPFVFTVTLSAPSAVAVTVGYATAAGTAIAGTDYMDTSGTLTFPPGVISRTIAVQVMGDTQVEADETFFVNLSMPVNATLAVAQATGTILNDDAIVPPPAVRAEAVPLLGPRSLPWLIVGLSLAAFMHRKRLRPGAVPTGAWALRPRRRDRRPG
jgi:hypothetical protein